MRGARQQRCCHTGGGAAAAVNPHTRCTAFFKVFFKLLKFTHVEERLPRAACDGGVRRATPAFGSMRQYAAARRGVRRARTQLYAN